MAWPTIIQSVFARNRDRVFLIQGRDGRSLGYADFERLSRQWAARLAASGLQPGARAGLLLPNSVHFAALYFACLFLGVWAVPINPALSRGEIDFILRRAGLGLLVFSPDVVPEAELPAPPGLKLLRLPAGGDGAGAVQPLEAGFAGAPGPEAPWSMHFTSGSTGRPKGVIHLPEALLLSAQSFNRRLEFGPEHRFYHVLPMAYMAGFLNTILCPFMAGASLVLGPTADARAMLRFWDTPIKRRVNVLWLTPSHLMMLLRADRGQSGKDYCRTEMQRLCVGTAPLPERVGRDFAEAYGISPLESYGLSETLFVAARGPGDASPAGAVGRALEGVDLQVVDQDGRELASGAEGEIRIRSRFMMAGYLDPDAGGARPVDQDGWFAAGDLGRIDRRGELFITQRKKDIIIRGGVNISPRLVEEAVLELPGVLQAAAAGVPDQLYGEAVAVGLILDRGVRFEELEPDLIRQCRRRLSPLARPSYFFPLPDMPLSSTGKVRKHVLARRLAKLAAGGQSGGKS